MARLTATVSALDPNHRESIRVPGHMDSSCRESTNGLQEQLMKASGRMERDMVSG